MSNRITPKVQAANWSEAVAFAELIFGKDPAITLQVFHDKNLDDSLAGHTHGRLSNAGVREWLLSSAASGAGIFFTLNEHDGTGRSRKTYKRSHCVAVDLDGAPLPQDPVLPFDIVIETSNGRFHGYHLIQPTTNAALWTAVQLAMAERYSGDRKCKDPARVFRLPGFDHQKGEPFCVRILHADEPFPRPTLEEVAAAYRVADAPALGRSDAPPLGTAHTGEFDNERDLEAVKRKLAATKPKDGERNDAAYKLAAYMDDHAISPEKQSELLHEWNTDVGLPDHEIDAVIEHAPRYKLSPPGSAAAISPEEDFKDAYIDPIWLPSKAEVEAKLKKRNRFAGMNMDQLENLPPLEWSIEGLIPKGQLIELYGPPKAGKTFAAMDMGLCIATGKSYHGRKVRKGRVLHIVGEGNKAAIRDRAKAWIIFNAKTPDERKQLEQDVRENWILVGVPVHINEPGILKEFFAANPDNYDFVIVDTLLRNMAGHISDPKDMAEFVRACDTIRDHYGAAVMVVHHEGKDKSKGGMGSIALDAAVDAILIFRREGKKRTLYVKEIRDGSSDVPSLIFELQAVPLTVDADTLESVVTSAALKLIGTEQKHGLSAAAKLLVAIYQANKPTGASLAAALGVSKAALTKPAKDIRNMKWMEAKGWKLTPDGIEAAQRLEEAE